MSVPMVLQSLLTEYHGTDLTSVYPEHLATEPDTALSQLPPLGTSHLETSLTTSTTSLQTAKYPDLTVDFLSHMTQAMVNLKSLSSPPEICSVAILELSRRLPTVARPGPKSSTLTETSTLTKSLVSMHTTASLSEKTASPLLSSLPPTEELPGPER